MLPLLWDLDCLLNLYGRLSRLLLPFASSQYLLVVGFCTQFHLFLSIQIIFVWQHLDASVHCCEIEHSRSSQVKLVVTKLEYVDYLILTALLSVIQHLQKSQYFLAIDFQYSVLRIEKKIKSRSLVDNQWIILTSFWCQYNAFKVRRLAFLFSERTKLVDNLVVEPSILLRNCYRKTTGLRNKNTVEWVSTTKYKLLHFIF